jgi:hypothetical protein
MVFALLCLILAVAAVYSGGAWLFLGYRNARGVFDLSISANADRFELFTFHLGLCCIVATGFLALILVLHGDV